MDERSVKLRRCSIKSTQIRLLRRWVWKVSWRVANTKTHIHCQLHRDGSMTNLKSNGVVAYQWTIRGKGQAMISWRVSKFHYYEFITIDMNKDTSNRFQLVIAGEYNRRGYCESSHRHYKSEVWYSWPWSLRCNWGILGGRVFEPHAISGAKNRQDRLKVMTSTGKVIVRKWSLNDGSKSTRIIWIDSRGEESSQRRIFEYTLNRSYSRTENEYSQISQIESHNWK
jgi:hypothetical protein